jgi:homoserine kinase type II
MRRWGDARWASLADDVQRHCEDVVGREERLRHDQVRQLVHGDFWDDNVVFRGGRLAGLLDFDFLGERDRVEELALTLWFYLLEPGNGSPDEQELHQVRSLLDAYDDTSVLPLTAAERERLPLAVARQPAWIAGSWIPVLDEARTRAQAADLATRLPTAATLLADLAAWTSALT